MVAQEVVLGGGAQAPGSRRPPPGFAQPLGQSQQRPAGGLLGGSGLLGTWGLDSNSIFAQRPGGLGLGLGGAGAFEQLQALFSRDDGMLGLTMGGNWPNGQDGFAAHHRPLYARGGGTSAAAADQQQRASGLWGGVSSLNSQMNQLSLHTNGWSTASS